MKKLLLILLCLPLLFSSCQEDDPTPSAAPPSSSSLCGNVTITVDGVGLTFSPSTITNCDGIAVISNNNGNLNQVGFTFTSWSGGMIEWICTAIIQEYNTANLPINLNQTYFGNNVPLSPTILNLGFNNLEANGTYSNNHPTTNPSVKNGSIIFTNIDYSNNLIDGSFSFTGYQTIGASPKQINCTFSDVPFTIQ